jgi:Bacterial Ig-like domain
MMTETFTKFLILSFLAIPIVAGCSNGKNGATGPAGQQGAQGQQGATGPTDPTVTWVMPVQGATGIYTDSVIKVGFSKPISSSTINSSTFIVSTGGVNVTGTVSYNPGSQTAYFDPYSPLVQFGFYTATLTTGIMDTEGNPLLNNYMWTFTVGGSAKLSKLYVLDYGGASIDVFNNAGTADGNLFPDRNISGGSTTISGPYAFWYDSASDQLYVANYGTSSIIVFDNASTANGNIAPARNISGGSTALNEPDGLWYDAATDQLYVANYGGASILVFNNASTADGNIAPSRTISGSNTTLDGASGLWYDSGSDQLYVANYSGAGILVFSNASTADGNIAPSRTISGGNTTLVNPAWFWLDTSSNQLYVADYVTGVLVFNDASTATGNIAPSRTISGSNTTLNGASGLWYDSGSNRLYVANYSAAGILVFNDASTATGNIAPSRTIFGGNTTLSEPSGVWLDMNP